MADCGIGAINSISSGYYDILQSVLPAKWKKGFDIDSDCISEALLEGDDYEIVGSDMQDAFSNPRLKPWDCKRKTEVKA